MSGSISATLAAEVVERMRALRARARHHARGGDGARCCADRERIARVITSLARERHPLLARAAGRFAVARRARGTRDAVFSVRGPRASGSRPSGRRASSSASTARTPGPPRTTAGSASGSTMSREIVAAARRPDVVRERAGRRARRFHFSLPLAARSARRDATRACSSWRTTRTSSRSWRSILADAGHSVRTARGGRARRSPASPRRCRASSSSTCGCPA